MLVYKHSFFHTCQLKYRKQSRDDCAQKEEHRAYTWSCRTINNCQRGKRFLPVPPARESEEGSGRGWGIRKIWLRFAGRLCSGSAKYVKYATEEPERSAQPGRAGSRTLSVCIYRRHKCLAGLTRFPRVRHECGTFSYHYYISFMHVLVCLSCRGHRRAACAAQVYTNSHCTPMQTMPTDTREGNIVSKWHLVVSGAPLWSEARVKT